MSRRIDLGNLSIGQQVTLSFRKRQTSVENGTNVRTGYGDMSFGVWIMAFGVLLMLIEVAFLVSWMQNVFHIVAGFFILVLGIGAFTTGLAGYTWWDRPPVPKVRCRRCYTLNYESTIKCRKCGADLF